MAYNKVGLPRAISCMLIKYVGHSGINQRGEVLILFMFQYNFFCTILFTSVLYVTHYFNEICSFNVDRSYPASGNHPVLNIDSKGHAVHAFLNNMLIGLFFTLLYVEKPYKVISLRRRLLGCFSISSLAYMDLLSSEYQHFLHGQNLSLRSSKRLFSQLSV